MAGICAVDGCPFGSDDGVKGRHGVSRGGGDGHPDRKAQPARRQEQGGGAATAARPRRQHPEGGAPQLALLIAWRRRRRPRV